MNYKKLYNKYINVICRKYYIFGFIYLILNIICVYYNVNINNFIYIFELEKFILIEVVLYLFLNGVMIIIIQLFFNKIVLKYNFLNFISFIFTFQLFIIYLKLIYDICVFGITQLDFVYYYNLILTYIQGLK